MRGKRLSMKELGGLRKSDSKYWIESINPRVKDGIYHLETNTWFISEDNENGFGSHCDSVLKEEIKVYEYEEEIVVKEYQTWEVIKMLTENSKLKFGVIPSYGSSKIPRCIASISEGGSIVWGDSNDSIYLSEAHIHYKWILMEDEPKQVPFIEAAQAFRDGKDIEVKYISLCDGEAINRIFKQSSTKGIMQINDVLTFYLAIEGKWFIK